MKKYRLMSAAIIALGFMAGQPASSYADEKVAKPGRAVQSEGAPIDIVFAIDCSGSMGGVIATAKQKVWDIVNEVAKAKPTPHLRIGLLGYGNADSTYRKYDLSDDLDTVYANLMKFRDEGWGSEYVGLAIDKSLKELSWSKARSGGASLRVIYVVGNETAAQGPLDYAKAAKKALDSDIFVNAIYCGSAGGQDTWQLMAKAGGGKYLEIAGDGGAILIETPYDAELAKLNTKLNGTYLGYGARREAAAMNQSAQDMNASSVGGSMNAASRTAAKASSQYRNSDWDLVDAVKEKKVDVGKLRKEELPEDLRKLTPDQLKAKVAAAGAERTKVQKEIQAVDMQRQTYIQAEMKKRGKDNSLDEAVRKSVRAQATGRGFTF